MERINRIFTDDIANIYKEFNFDYYWDNYFTRYSIGHNREEIFRDFAIELKDIMNNAGLTSEAFSRYYTILPVRNICKKSILVYNIAKPCKIRLILVGANKMNEKNINEKNEHEIHKLETPNSGNIIRKKVIEFLCLFVCKTLAKRIICIILIEAGVDNKRINELTGVSSRSIHTYREHVENGTIDTLFIVGGGGRTNKLKDVEELIFEEIENNNYHSHQQIADMIQEKFKIKISLSSVGRFLKKKGIKRLKCGSLPAKADPKEQRNFWENTLQPLVNQAKEQKIALFFVDSSHFVMGCDFLGYIYGTARRFIKTFSGRQRYNVLGALNFITKKITTITNDAYHFYTDM